MEIVYLLKHLLFMIKAIALKDREMIMETLYLMRSPANAQHLMDAIARDKAGEYEQHDLID